MTKLQKMELLKMKIKSDEEEIIANVLSKCADTIEYPVLDIGSGSGKISTMAFGDKEVIHLDQLSFLSKDFLIPKNHKRIVGDFFKFDAKSERIKTLLFCHSLQYLDDNGIKLVLDKIKDINPKYVLLVINNNDGVLGDFLEIFEKNGWSENGEKHFPEFPGNQFVLKENFDITGNFFGKNATEMVYLLCGLILDVKISRSQEKILTSVLDLKNITHKVKINQKLCLYINSSYNDG